MARLELLVERRAGAERMKKATSRFRSMLNAFKEEFYVKATPPPTSTSEPNTSEEGEGPFLEDTEDTEGTKGTERTIFNAADADGDGELSLEEAIAAGYTEAEYKAMDEDGDGHVVMSEFLHKPFDRNNPPTLDQLMGHG